MASKKDFIRWVLAAIAVPIVAILADLIVLSLLFLTEGTFFMLLFYISIPVLPIISQFFIIRYIAPKHKNVAGFIAVIAMIILHVIVMKNSCYIDGAFYIGKCPQMQPW